MGLPPLAEASELVVHRGTKRVLESVSLSIQEGQIVALVGKNGSGKTTLIEAFAGIIPLRKGSIFWRGRDGESVTVRDFEGRRNHPPPMGLTLQKDGMCGDETVIERFSSALEVAGSEFHYKQASETLEQWGLSNFSEDRIAHLSGGLSRRLSLLCGLAPAALSDLPLVTLLDEPSEGLDEAAKELLKGWLRALAMRGHGIVIATHDKEVIDCADRIVTISDGNITEKPGDANSAPSQIPAISDFHEPNPTLSLVKWALRTEYRNPIDTVGKATPAIVALLLAYALVGELDVNSHDSRLLAALVLAPSFITAVASPAIIGRLSESDCGRWWNAVVGPMARPAYSISGASMVLPIPLAYLSWAVLAGSVEVETYSEVLVWLWLPALAMLDLAVAATSLHLLVSDLSRSSAAPAPLLLLVLVWPFLELTEALAMIIDGGMSFSLSIHEPIMTCLIASIISALVWLAAVLIPDY